MANSPPVWCFADPAIKLRVIVRHEVNTYMVETPIWFIPNLFYLYNLDSPFDHWLYLLWLFGVLHHHHHFFILDQHIRRVLCCFLFETSIFFFISTTFVVFYSFSFYKHIFEAQQQYLSKTYTLQSIQVSISISYILVWLPH